MKESSHFDWSVRVYWEDTDAGGVVYYANYLRFMERARTEWLSALGLEQDHMLREAGLLFVVRRVEVDYLRPARFNDRLLVRSHLAELGRASMVLSQEVLRGSERLLAARVQVACVEPVEFRPARMPTFVTERLHP